MRAIIVGLSVVGAFLAGLTAGTLRRDAPPAPGAPRQAVAAAAAPPTVRVDLGAVRGDLREILREELAAARAETPSAPAPAPAGPSPEEEAATAEADGVVVAARAAGRWTRSDAAALRALMPRLAPDQRAELLSTLVPAMNSGELRVDPDVWPPL